MKQILHSPPALAHFVASYCFESLPTSGQGQDSRDEGALPQPCYPAPSFPKAPDRRGLDSLPARTRTSIFSTPHPQPEIHSTAKEGRH